MQVKVNSTDKQPGPARGSNLTGPVSDTLIDWTWMRSINNLICSVLTNLFKNELLCITLWQVYLSEVQHTHCIWGKSTAQLSIRHTWTIDLLPDSLVYLGQCTFHWSSVVDVICACGGYFLVSNCLLHLICCITLFFIILQQHLVNWKYIVIILAFLWLGLHTFNFF